MRDFSERLTGTPSHTTAGTAHADTDSLRTLLAALRAHDAYTYSHSVRTVSLSLLLGRVFGINGADLRVLCLGAFLHDIGKVLVPETVLHKPGRLTAGEWQTVRQHPQEGARLISAAAGAAGVVRIVAEHHERWDGAGYPAGLRGAEITLPARIVAVADAFDAMTSARAYRVVLSYEAAVAELGRCAGTQFDPLLVEAFNRTPRARIERCAWQRNNQ